MKLNLCGWKKCLGLFLSSLFCLPAFSSSNWQLLSSVNQEYQRAIAISTVKNVFKDENGGQYQVYDVSENPHLRAILDVALIDFIETSIGSSLCKFAFDGKIDAFAAGIGLSAESVNKLDSSKCKTSPKVDWVLDQGSKAGKTTLAKSRGYAIVITDSETWPYDSWTDHISNKTYLIFRKIENGIDFRPLKLRQYLFHELGVFFDAKFWVDSAHWREVPEFKTVTDNLGLPNLAATNHFVGQAFNNPLINYSLSFVRALKVEKNLIFQWVRKLEEAGYADWKSVRDAAQKDYDLDKYRVLNSSCGHSCLFEFVSNLAYRNVDIAFPLIVLSPYYREQMVSDLKKKTNSQESRALIEALTQASESLAESSFSQDPFYMLVDPLLAVSYFQTHILIKNFFSFEYLRGHLNVLNSSYYLYSTGEYKSFIEFLAEPKLSTLNTNMNLGPRTRIRSGIIGTGPVQ